MESNKAKAKEMSPRDLGKEEFVESQYMNEQYAAVKRIQNCKNFYEVLNVNKNAPKLDINKAYRKLALQLHPDKNKCPGAGEAFKILVNAATVLMDPKRRYEHDLLIMDKEVFGNRTRLNDIKHNKFEGLPTSLEELLDSLFRDVSENTSYEYNSRKYKEDSVFEELPRQEKQGTFEKMLGFLRIRRVDPRNFKRTCSIINGIRIRDNKTPRKFRFI